METLSHYENNEKQLIFNCCDNCFNNMCIQCDYCNKWFHGSCNGLQEYEVGELDKYFCDNCQKINTEFKSTRKPVTNFLRHNISEPIPEGKPTQSGTTQFIKQLKRKKFSDAKHEDSVLKQIKGSKLTINEFLDNGFDVPILVDSKYGLGLTVPSNFSYNNILDYFPSDYILDVIDVRRQKNTKIKAQFILILINQMIK